MEGTERWGRRGGKGTPGGCKDGILKSMKQSTAPGATMDKKNGNKVLPQGKTAVREGLNHSNGYKNAHGNSLGGGSDAPQNLIHRGRDKLTSGHRVQTVLAV